MREKKAIKNVITNIIVQIILAVSGLMIPRLLMYSFGSEVNGMVSSISQFITYAALIEMGIGNASVVALYKPIATQDYSNISSIVTSAKKMYSISGCIYIAIILCIAGCYPLLFKEQFGFGFVFKLVLCIGVVNAIDYFIIGKYKVLLIADQKYYIINITKSVATILLTLGSVIFVFIDKDVIWIKGLAIVTHFGEAVLIYLYIKIKYPLISFKMNVTSKIPQRWNALVHQLCATIVYNTDIVVLTLCLPQNSLYEISVYSVYSMVFSVVSNMTGTLTTGINASFGDMFAKGEKEYIRKAFDVYEFFFFIALFILYSCFLVLIIPFVSCYTKGMNDVNYVRLQVGILFGINGLTAQLKEVSGVIINAAGKYKETQRYAVEEALINIGISLILVRSMGITGVLIGTLISHIWMDIRFMVYMCNNLIQNTGIETVRRVCRNFLLGLLLVSIEMNCIFVPSKWSLWIIEAIVIAVINSILILLVNFSIEREKFMCLRKIRHRRMKS